MLEKSRDTEPWTILSLPILSDTECPASFLWKSITLSFSFQDIPETYFLGETTPNCAWINDDSLLGNFIANAITSAKGCNHGGECDLSGKLDFVEVAGKG